MSETVETEEVEVAEVVETVEAAKSVAVEVNSIVSGEILRIKPFGAIVLLPDNRQGLVHISHISSKYVQDIEEYVSVGDVVTVKVLSIEVETGKISLSMKEAEPPKTFERRPEAAYQPQGEQSASFEDKFKDWLKNANERQAGLNKRNKRR